MGRNGLIDAHEAGKLLGVTPQQVRRYAREGILAAYLPEGSKLGSEQFYNIDEVREWAKKKSEKVSIHKVYAISVRAEAIAQSNRREINRLRMLTGCNLTPVEYDEASVKDLCLKAKDALKKPPTEVTEVVEWTRHFFGIHKEFFQLAELYTDNPQPWLPFLTLGELIHRNSPIGRFVYEKDLEAAYGYFNSSRRHLNFAIHLFVTMREDLAAANKVIPEAETNVYERLINHLYLPNLDRQDPDSH